MCLDASEKLHSWRCTLGRRYSMSKGSQKNPLRCWLNYPNHWLEVCVSWQLVKISKNFPSWECFVSMDCPRTWIARCVTGPGTLGRGLRKHVSRSWWGICSSDTSLGAMIWNEPFLRKERWRRSNWVSQQLGMVCPDASGTLCVSCHWTANRKGEQFPLDILHGSNLWYVPSLPVSTRLLQACMDEHHRWGSWQEGCDGVMVFCQSGKTRTMAEGSDCPGIRQPHKWSI